MATTAASFHFVNALTSDARIQQDFGEDPGDGLEGQPAAKIPCERGEGGWGQDDGFARAFAGIKIVKA